LKTIKITGHILKQHPGKENSQLVTNCHQLKMTAANDKQVEDNLKIVYRAVKDSDGDNVVSGSYER